MEYNTYGIAWMEDVGSRRVVDNDDFVEISSDQVEIFDVVTAVKHTRLTEQARCKHSGGVQ